METKRRSRLWLRRCCVVALVMTGAVELFAQSTSTLTGTVVDDTGGVIPGATVTATHADTGTSRTVPTSKAGLFRIVALAPGHYTLHVDLAGFTPVTMTELFLVAAEVRDVGKVVLRVGAQTESVSVRAQVTPVQVASSERSASVMGDQLQNIQLKGRDVFGFLSTVPGALDTNNSRDFTTWTSMRGVSFNGAPHGTKNVTIDGVNVIDEGANQNAFVNPNIDAVGEVRVLTNGFQAEYGRNAGGTINIITKSGTSELRASGWYNYRHDRFNANSFFNRLRGLDKPLYRINIGGYAVGGPVMIPKLFDARHNLFFFASQEFTDDALPVDAVTANLPTEAERQGDFSNTRQPDGSILPIIDPLTGRPFPGNVIPQHRISPTGQALLNLLPLPNGYVNSEPGQQFTANFQSQQTPLHNRRNDVVRVDARLTDRLSTYVKFIHDKEETTSFSLVAPGEGTRLNFVPGWVVSGHVTHVLSPTMVNELTVGFGHNNYGNRMLPEGSEAQYYRSALGVDPPRLRPFAPTSGSEPAIAGLQTDEWPYVPIMSFSGGNRTNLATYNGAVLGSRPFPQANRNDRFSVQNDLSITRGRHNFKSGIYVEYSSKTEPNLGANYVGNFDFGSNPDNPLDTGYGYANALLGSFQTYTESTNRANPDMRQWQIEGYVQDNWHVSSRLTLDYGVRLTHNGPYSEKFANAGFFPELYDPDAAARLYRPICLSGAGGDESCPRPDQRAIDPLTGELVPIAFQNNIVPGSGDPVNGMQLGGRTGRGDYYDYPTVVAAPRFGVAWDLTGDGKTALRASAGIFYNRLGKSEYNPFLGRAPVFFDRIVRFATLDEIPNLADAAVVSPVSGAGIVQGERTLERAYEYNVTFQREVGFNTVVEVAYVGNFIRHSQQNKDANPIPLYAYADSANLFNGAAIDENFLRTNYPGLGSLIDVASDRASLDYHGLQVQAQRRLHNGLQFGVAYTLSKAEGMQGWDPYVGYSRERYYGPTQTDRRHMLVVNYAYELPNPTQGVPALKHLLGNWQVSGITRFTTGAPVTPTCRSTNAGIASRDPSLTGVEARCQLVDDPFGGFTEGGDPATAVHFNTAAFEMAQPVSATVGNFGNTPLGILRQPSWSNWDITLAKRISIPGGSMRLQIQAYNVFNTAQFTEIGTTYQFTGPGNAVNLNTQTGRYTATNNPRQLGFTLRIEY